MTTGALAVYRDKRDFGRTPEPKGEDVNPGGNRSRFVIQKHAASTLHYDFRLEAEGVLKSWAVPKGPSTDPREKRLATRTEDHPVEYLDLEGVIPEGEYGAGSVIVWDTGTYANQSEREGETIPVAEAIDGGHVSVRLEGHKLAGGYALTRFRGKDDWLLVKMNDDEADARRNPTSSQPKSVLSGRTVEEVEKQEGPSEGEES